MAATARRALNFCKAISKRSKGGIIRTTRDDRGASRDWWRYKSCQVVC